MKKLVVLLGLLSIFAFGCSKAATPTEPVQEEPKSEAGVFPPGAFLTEIPKDNFEALKLEDFPGSEHRRMLGGVWEDRVFLLGYPYVYEYSWNGEMLAYTDTKQVECADDFVVIKNSLFVSCYNKGIYEVNLETNKVVNFYDQKSGIKNIQNLTLAADEQFLWVGTFDGVAKIDTESGKVAFYTSELKIVGQQFNTRVYARNGEVWAQVIAADPSEGGASKYDYKTDTWHSYGPAAFKTTDLGRVDFNPFIVSDNGIFVGLQDGGPEKEVLKKFDAEKDTWETVYTEAYKKFNENVEKYLPPLETYTNSGWAGANKVKVFDGSKWREFDFKYANYRAMVFFSNQYYLLTDAGLEIFGQEDKLPQKIASSDKIYGIFSENSELFVTDDQKYLVFLTNGTNEMMGGWTEFSVGVYNLTSGEFFDREIDFKPFEESLPAGVANLTHTYANEKLTLNFPDGKTSVIDLVK